MQILIVAATEKEVAPLLDYCSTSLDRAYFISIEKETLKVDVLVTGIGMMVTAYKLSAHLSKKRYDLAINIGICGAFDKTIELGAVISIDSETYGDLGAKNNNGFLDLEELNLMDANNPIVFNKPSFNLNIDEDLLKVKGISVNNVSSVEDEIRWLSNKYDPLVESMEGIAFFYACLQHDVPFFEIRGVSNYVEKRNKENWELEKAIENSNKYVIQVLKDLNKSS